MICFVENLPEINGVYALICFAVLFVFFVAIAFVFCAIRTKSRGKQAKQTVDAPKSQENLAPGSSGDLILKNVTEKEAALVMAIMAYELDAPLNSLKFVSIAKTKGEVEKDEI